MPCWKCVTPRDFPTWLLKIICEKETCNGECVKLVKSNKRITSVTLLQFLVDYITVDRNGFVLRECDFFRVDCVAMELIDNQCYSCSGDFCNGAAQTGAALKNIIISAAFVLFSGAIYKFFN